jgi:hypothetical protein
MIELESNVAFVVEIDFVDLVRGQRLVVCTESPIRVDDVMESPKLAE